MESLGLFVPSDITLFLSLSYFEPQVLIYVLYLTEFILNLIPGIKHLISHMLRSAICHEHQAPLESTDLSVDLVQAGSMFRSLLPALLHQLDAFGWPMVRGHPWPAQGRG